MPRLTSKELHDLERKVRDIPRVHLDFAEAHALLVEIYRLRGVIKGAEQEVCDATGVDDHYLALELRSALEDR